MMSRNELKQKMILCICTLQKLNGSDPTATELRSALGSEYEDVIAEYYGEKRLFTLVA